jgi:hypothetical protein
MEMMQTLIVIECLVLGLLLCLAAGYFYLQSRRITDTRVFGLLSLVFYYCLPGIVGAVFPPLLRFVVPLARPDVMLPLAIGMPLMTASVCAGIFIRFGQPKRRSAKQEWKLARQLAIQYWPGRLFLVSFLFFCLGLIGVYKELHTAGGWFAVLQAKDSTVYMEARGQTAGFWGALISFIPVAAIGMMQSTVLSRAVPRALRWPIVLAILTGSIGLISLLTTRHLSVMLLLSVIALLELRSRKLFRMVAPVVLVMVVIAAAALASVRYSSKTRNIDKLTGNFQQIHVSEKIISEIHVQGYVWGGNIPDLFTVLVPRAIWPNKPIGSRINHVVFWEAAKVGGIKTEGLLGEAYASGGLAFVILEGFIFGVMLRRLPAVWERRRANSFQFMAYGAVILGYIYMTARMGFIGPQDYTFFLIVAQIKVSDWLCGYRIEQESFQPASAVPAIGGASTAV